LIRGTVLGGAFIGVLGGGTLGVTLGKVFSSTAFGGTVLGCMVMPGVLRFLAGVLGVFTRVFVGLPADLGGLKSTSSTLSTSFSSMSSISDPPPSGLFRNSVRGFTTAWNRVS
jgi:hypothetical protein